MSTTLTELSQRLKCTAMQSIGDVNLTTYTPVHSHAYYGDVSVSETGSVRPIEPLTAEIVDFLQSIGINVSDWNGTEGVLGRSYVSTVSSEGHELTLEGINRLRSRYIDVKRSLYIHATRQQLLRELSRQTELQRQLDDAVLDAEQKIEWHRTKLYTREVRKGDQGVLHDSLSKALHKLERELPISKRAAEAIRKKVLQTRVDVTENETGFLRRFAILRSIFSETSTWTGLTDQYYKGSDDLVSAAKTTDKESKSAWTKVLQAKRFYVDAKIGLACLYKVENTLKSILENLEQTMKAQNGNVCQPISSLPSQVGVEYRLGYIRKLWGSVEPAFKAAIPYVEHTSLRGGFDFILAEKTSNDLESLFESNPKDYAAFLNSHAVLRCFSKIERAHPINKTAKIAALHKGAAAAYKIINKVYDSQEVWIQKAVLELKEREKEERIANEGLIAIWERLLGIETENM